MNNGQHLEAQAINYNRTFIDGAGRAIDELIVYATDTSGALWWWVEHHYTPDPQDPHDTGIYASAEMRCEGGIYEAE